MNTDPGVLVRRVADLEALFTHVGATRMAGIPILHPGLRVQAVGFERDGDAAVGVLVTPWFMNLVRLPLEPSSSDLPVGQARERPVGNECFSFIVGHEDGFGSYEACSLFSPMAEFVDHEAAVATARAVLDTLRQPPQVIASPPVAMSRRALLFGRPAATDRRAAIDAGAANDAADRIDAGAAATTPATINAGAAG